MNVLEQQADAAAAKRDFARAKSLLSQLVAAQPDAFGPRLKLAVMQRATREPTAALASLMVALKLNPFDFSALMMRATLLETTGSSEEAGLAYGRALAQAPEPVPPHLADVLKTARQRYSTWQEKQAETLRAAARTTGPIAPALDRLITNAVRLTEPDREGPTHYCYPDLPEIPFHDRTRFPWLTALEAATDTIQAEFEAMAAANVGELVPYIQYPDTVPLDQWKALNRNKDWTAIHLIERGVVNHTNAQHCPETMKLLEAIPQPQIAGAGPNAMFSLLAPGTHIPPHTGITNTRLVCHLPLIVPSGCWFRVGNDRREWARGAAWVFDDTIEHEAMNPSDALRVILIVDVWHPDLDDAARRGVAAVIGAGGQVHGL